ncbi:uncharacterized protein LOC126890015 isoform X2 [Diabrotica virgifera virgifera]|uniref:Uncharacterized protein LOC114347227 n=1 Tax=Diabrotica virgifera virgifera TaxID=50390 RepID=A0A6P7GW76_DIAVI|nr:uncharacterized protein LOC126890015 isoform X2 [Diabrotica virgifera virgifera]
MADDMQFYTEPTKPEGASNPGINSPDTYFDREKTLLLIDLFKKYKPVMTKGDIKTMKEMWDVIANDLSNQFEKPITGSKCKNKFKVLERGYKKMLNDDEIGKRRKKNFPYAKEFKDIQPRKYEFVPGLVHPYTNIPNTITTTERNDTSSTESATEVGAEVTYTESLYISEENYVNENHIEVCQTDYVNGTTQEVEPAEITIQTTTQSEMHWPEDNYFNKDRTLYLISLYKIFSPKVTMGEMKTKREMWDAIAKQMSEHYTITITSAKCENRFKVLERNFRQLEIHNKQPDNLPKTYEYEAELREIFGDRFKNQVKEKIVEKPEPTTSAETIDINQQPYTIRLLETQSIPIELQTPDKLERILLGIRSDLQYYQNERLKVEWRKLAVEEEKLKLDKRKLKLLEDQRRENS